MFANDHDHKLERAFYAAIGYMKGTDAGSFLLDVKTAEDIIVYIELPENMNAGFKGNHEKSNTAMTLFWDPEAANEYPSRWVASPTVILAHESRHLAQYLFDFGRYTEPLEKYGNPREKDAIVTWETEVYNHIHGKSFKQTRYSHNMKNSSVYLVRGGVASTHAQELRRNGGQVGYKFDSKNNRTNTGGYKTGSRYLKYYGVERTGTNYSGRQVDPEEKKQFKQKFKPKYVKDAAGNKVGVGSQ